MTLRSLESWGRLLALLVMVLVPAAAAQQPGDTEHVKLFRLKSKRLTDFHGLDTFVEAGVVLPPDFKAKEKLPVCYSVHGFGGSHREAWRTGRYLVRSMERGYPRMIYVFLNARCPLGHHVFADSANNGPWGAALTREFIPALEKEFHAAGRPGGRFLTGHSSGGWSSLWLQVAYPGFFGGTWSTAPDPVDFRDFTGVNIYKDKSAYRDVRGKEIPLIRRGKRWVMTFREFCQRELRRVGEQGGQMASFDAVFSPRGKDGRPLRLFDRKTGAIDPAVAEAWKKYDIRLVLRQRWKTFGPKLRGKIRVYTGTLDNFRLEGATRLLKKELKNLGSDARIVLVKGRDHGTLFRPYKKLWPDGLLAQIHAEMQRTFRKKRR